MSGTHFYLRRRARREAERRNRVLERMPIGSRPTYRYRDVPAERGPYRWRIERFHVGRPVD